MAVRERSPWLRSLPSPMAALLLLVAVALATPVDSLPTEAAASSGAPVDEGPRGEPVDLGGMAPPVLTSESGALARAVGVSALGGESASPRAGMGWGPSPVRERQLSLPAPLPLYLRHCSLLS